MRKLMLNDDWIDAQAFMQKRSGYGAKPMGRDLAFRVVTEASKGGIDSRLTHGLRLVFAAIGENVLADLGQLSQQFSCLDG